MKIFVTGCAGFIGSHTCEYLLQRGDHVLGIDNLNDYYAVERKQENLAVLKKYEHFEWWPDFHVIKQLPHRITRIQKQNSGG